MLTGTAALTFAGAARADEPILTDDGLYKQPWFLESFLDLADDLDGARSAGQALCGDVGAAAAAPIARRRISSISRSARIADYVRANFDILQLNIIGSRKVTDFDGQELSEKDLAAKYGVRFTPTFQFFRRRLGAPQSACRRDKREVARAPGYLRPDDFLSLFRYVREKAYEGKSFPRIPQDAAELK